MCLFCVCVLHDVACMIGQGGRVSKAVGYKGARQNSVRVLSFRQKVDGSRLKMVKFKLKRLALCTASASC